MLTSERRWLELTGDLLATPLVELPAERIALELLSTLQGTACSWTRPGPDGVFGGAIYPLTERLGGRRVFMEDWVVRNAPHVRPILLRYRDTGRPEVTQLADVPDRFVPPRVRGVWQEVARPWGGAEQVALPLLGGGALVVAANSRFTPAAMALTRRVHRLVLGLDRQCRALAGRGPSPVVARDLRLTARQLAVLGLLADGLTAGAIGRRLGISERTVHKHLEHLYSRLRVGDRLSAVLRAREDGLLP